MTGEFLGDGSKIDEDRVDVYDKGLSHNGTFPTEVLNRTPQEAVAEASELQPTAGDKVAGLAELVADLPALINALAGEVES